MKTAICLLFALSIACFGLDITTSDGTIYTQCEVKRVEVDALFVTHSNGNARILYEKLPHSLQAQYFDPAKVAAYRQQQQEAKQAVEAKAAAIRQEDEQAARKREQDARRTLEQEKQREAERRAEAEKKEREKGEAEQRREMLRTGIRVLVWGSLSIFALWLFFTNVGAFLALVGVATTVYFFFVFDTSVSTEAHYIPGIGTIGGQRVVNLGRLHDRDIGCIIGVGLFIAGIVISAVKSVRSKN